MADHPTRLQHREGQYCKELRSSPTAPAHRDVKIATPTSEIAAKYVCSAINNATKYGLMVLTLSSRIWSSRLLPAAPAASASRMMTALLHLMLPEGFSQGYYKLLLCRNW